jgi:PPOX class probable F420-dependent enzyme
MPVAQEKLQAFLDQRLIATLATRNDDDSSQLTAVWYRYDGTHVYVAVSAGSRKVRNIRARPEVSIMIDSRKLHREKGAATSGRAELIEGERAFDLRRQVFLRYMHRSALDDPSIGERMTPFGDVIIRIKPRRWTWWDMEAGLVEVFGDRVFDTYGDDASEPGMYLPLD